MAELSFIIVLAIAVVLIIAGVNAEDGGEGFALGLFFCFMVTIAIVVGVELWGCKPIQPIDVYRGNTTLEITYRDSVAVDSVVVWKEETK